MTRRALKDGGARAARSELPSPWPRRVGAAARKLLKEPGVVGVFWGTAQRRGRWTTELCLSVHVERKLPAGKLRSHQDLRSIAGDVPIDVIETGRPRGHWLDGYDLVLSEGDPARGFSTVTAVALDRKGGVVLGLLSGHGALPRIDGVIASHVGGAAPRHRVITGDFKHETFLGDVLVGRFDARCDFAVASFGSPDRIPFVLAHPVHDLPTPLPVAVSAVGHGTTVRIWSNIPWASRPTTPRGRVSVGAPGPAKIWVGSQSVWFPALYAVRSTSAAYPFSVPGDSGALVVDDAKRCVGTVVGGSSDTAGVFSYVLPVSFLLDELGAYKELFFRV